MAAQSIVKFNVSDKYTVLNALKYYMYGTTHLFG